jgi:L-fuconolactonase
MIKIDSHQHFWKFNSEDYGWIDEDMKVLKRDYLPRHLEQELLLAGFTGSVVVQARQIIEESRWLLDLADRYDFIKGVVGWVDLRSGDDLKCQLDELAVSEKFVGVRHVVHDEPDDLFMLDKHFLRGLSLLKDYNLTYDLLLFPKHLPVAEKVVAMFPDQKFIVDHISKPPIREGILSPWNEDLLRLAEHSNVWCKLSGIVTEADWKNQSQEDFRPYLDFVFKAFGPERLMVGSDWPVCLLAGEYSKVIGIVEKYISKMPDDIRQKIMGINCLDFYGLG